MRNSSGQSVTVGYAKRIERALAAIAEAALSSDPQLVSRRLLTARETQLCVKEFLAGRPACDVRQLQIALARLNERLDEFALLERWRARRGGRRPGTAPDGGEARANS